MLEYYIVCKRHMHRKDHAILFWGPNHQGYRYNINDAGRYSEEEIKFIDSYHYCDDMPVQRGVVDMAATEAVIDNRVLGLILKNTKSNRDLIGMKLTELHGGESNWDSRAFCDPKRFLHMNEGREKLLAEIRSRTSCAESAGQE